MEAKMMEILNRSLTSWNKVLAAGHDEAASILLTQYSAQASLVEEVTGKKVEVITEDDEMKAVLI